MRAELTKLIGELVAADPRSNDTFQKIIPEAMSLLALDDHTVAMEFSATRPTVEAWRQGRNAPHPAMRPPIYDYFRGVAEQRLTT